MNRNASGPDEVREKVADVRAAIDAHRLLAPFLGISQVAVDLDLASSIHPCHYV